jgi:SAM-dependent methyltransferase
VRPIHGSQLPPEAAPGPVQRWGEVLGHLTRLLPAQAASVLVDGHQALAAVLADRLVEALHALGRPSARLGPATPLADEDAWYADRSATTVAVADGPGWRAYPPTGRWDLVIWLRTGRATADREPGADVVVDVHDPAWPVIRHPWYLSESRAFFATRAATWDAKFGDDLPAYARAVAGSGLVPGGVVLDAGCGTGRALPALRQAVGPAGTVLGLDLTPQMLAVAATRARTGYATLVLGDARHLPLADASVDAVFAAGLLTHLPDSVAALGELARVTRPGGRLVLFHPCGRATLAARHGRTLRPDEPLAEASLRQSTMDTGWRLDAYDDAPERFYARATRVQQGP